MDEAAAFHPRPRHDQTRPLVDLALLLRFWRFRFHYGGRSRGWPGFDRDVLYPGDAVDNCSAKKRRKRQRIREPARPAIARGVAIPYGFRLSRSFLDQRIQ